MTRINGVISVLGACMFFSAASARGDDTNFLYDSELHMQPPGTRQGQKDECLLVAKNCPDSYRAGKIDRLKREIAKGTDVYTEQELKMLNEKLHRLNEEMRDDNSSE